MRERGDGYRSILSYLENQTTDAELRKAVIRELDELEKNAQLQLTKESSPKIFSMGVVIGVVLLGLGSALMVHLWNQGWISTLPLVIVGAGFLGLTKSIR